MSNKRLARCLGASCLLFILATPVHASDPACREQLAQAARLGLIRDMQATGEGMVFIVDEEIFLGMAFASKEGLVEAINCGLLEDGKQFNPIIFRSHRSNREIGRQSWGTLTIP
jgi:hypothetical protein